MTRKHFQLIAQTVALITDTDARSQMADTWVTVLSGINPKFKPSRFRKVCGVPSKPAFTDGRSR